MSIPKFFRGDAAFANPALYRVLEKEGYHYAIRIKANAVLEREIEHLLTRPVGRPSREPDVISGIRMFKRRDGISRETYAQDSQ